MNRLPGIILLFVVFVAICAANDEIYRKGIPGSYSRALGMEATVIELRSDGIYVITVRGCVWSEDGKGRWTVKDGSVILDGKGHPKDKKNKLTKFEIVPLDHDLALRALDDIFEFDDKNADDYLFTHQKKDSSDSLDTRHP